MSNKLIKSSKSYELKSCPFCGSRVGETNGFMGFRMFVCTNYKGCGATVSFDCDYANEKPERAVELFNRRV